jgi:hypothetical protein
MIQDTYTTPEGFELHRPLLLPDARSFDEVLTYVREWEFEEFRKNPDLAPEPRVIGDEQEYRRKGNAVGPFCTIDLSQVGGKKHRSVAVVATDATIEAITGRIVTPDDTLSFKLIAHKATNRVLVVAQHGYIIGSHYVAYIDPATIPAYPYEARDATYERVCRAIKEEDLSPFVRELPGGEREVTVLRKRKPPLWRNEFVPNLKAVIHIDGAVTRTWADGTTTYESVA